MADVENFTPEQAQELLLESLDKIHGEEPKTPAAAEPPVVEEPKPAVETPDDTKPDVIPEADDKATKDKVADTPADKPATDKPSKEDPYAWVEKLPEDLREKVVGVIRERSVAEHKFTSNNGRISAMQQQILNLHRELSNRAPASKSAPAEQPAPTTPEGWADLMKSDPELAKAMEARIKAEVEAAVGSFESKLQEMKTVAVDPLYEDRHQRFMEEQRQELSSLVPNYVEVMNHEAFHFWRDKVASEGIRNLANTSPLATDAVSVLREYANYMNSAGHGKAEDTPSNKSQVVTDTSAADKLAEERARKAAASTNIKAPPVSPVPGLDKGPVTADQADQIFKEVWKTLHPKK